MALLRHFPMFRNLVFLSIEKPMKITYNEIRVFINHVVKKGWRKRCLEITQKWYKSAIK